MSGLLILYICVFLDLFAVGIVIPLLPYYASSLGAEPWLYGLLGTTYGLVIHIALYFQNVFSLQIFFLNNFILPSIYFLVFIGPIHRYYFTVSIAMLINPR
jgi:hypothetical protein